MKITKSQLKQIIKEELSKLLLEYEQYVYRNSVGELRVTDDYGRDRAFTDEEKKYGGYGWLEPKQGTTIVGSILKPSGYRSGRSKPRRLRDKDIVDLDLRRRR
jgi:hypothetical protein